MSVQFDPILGDVRDGTVSLAEQLAGFNSGTIAQQAAFQAAVSGYKYRGTLSQILAITGVDGDTAIITGIGAVGYLIVGWSGAAATWKLLYTQNIACDLSAVVGSATAVEQSLKNITLPAGLLGLCSGFEVDAVWSRDNTSSTPWIRLRLGLTPNSVGNPEVMGTGGLNGSGRIRQSSSRFIKRSVTQLAVLSDFALAGSFVGTTSQTPLQILTTANTTTNTLYLVATMDGSATMTPTIEHFIVRVFP